MNAWFQDDFISFTGDAPSDGHFFTIFTNLISPSARESFWCSSTAPSLRFDELGGNITLASKNPFDHPAIHPNFLSTDFDIFTLREAIKAAHRYMSVPAWNGWILQEYGAFAQVQTDEEIEQYIRNSAEIVNHVSGTSAMGRTGRVGSGSSGPQL